MANTSVPVSDLKRRNETARVDCNNSKNFEGGNSLFEYSNQGGRVDGGNSSVGSYLLQGLDASFQKTPVTAQQPKRRSKQLASIDLINQNKIQIQTGAHVIQQALPSVPQPNTRLSTAVDQNVEPQNLNFSSFRHKKPMILRSPKKPNDPQLVQRSLNEWSTDIRDSFCRGLGPPATSNQDQRLNKQQFVRNSLQNTFTRGVQPNNLHSSLDSDSIGCYTSQFGDDLQSEEQAMQEGSLDSRLGVSSAAAAEQSQGTRARLCSRVFKSKHKQALSTFVTNQIEQDCKNKLAVQSQLSNLSAMQKQSAIQNSQIVDSTRHSLIRKLGSAHRSPQSDAQSSTGAKKLKNFAKMRANQKRVESPSSQKERAAQALTQRMRKPPTTFERRQLLKELKKLEEKAMLGEKDQLWKQLHQDLVHCDDEEEGGQQELRLQSEMFNKKGGSLLGHQNSHTESGYKQLKYQGLGEIGEYYARREFDTANREQRHDQECLAAAKANIHVPWTSERVANKITRKNAPKTIQYLMERDKGFKDNFEFLKDKFCEKVDDYVNDIAQNQNFECTKIKADDQDTHVRQESPQSFKNMTSQINQDLLSSPISSLLSPCSDDSLETIQKRDKIKKLGNKKVKIERLDQYIVRAREPYDLNDFGKEMFNKLEYQQICKDAATKAEGLPGQEGDPRLKYFVEADKFTTPAFDLLSKVHHKKLLLQEYNMQLGLCSGFVEACKQSPDMVEELTLDNCCIGTGALPVFMQGVTHLRRLRQLCLKRTTIDSESAQSVHAILDKYVPCAVEDFRIEKCTIPIEAMTKLLQSLVACNQVYKLAIVGQTLTIDQIAILTRFFLQTKQLSTIDLSYCRVSAVNFLPLLKSISQNHHFVNINIAGNKLLKNTQFAAVGFESVTQSEQTRANSSMLRAESQLSQQQKEGASKGRKDTHGRSEHDQAVMESLYQMCRNDKLQHLDFSECGLTAEILIKIMRPIRDNTGLLAIHLSGNPGLNSEVERRFITKLDATYEPSLNLESFQMGVGRNDYRQDLRTKIKDPVKQQKLIMESMQVKAIQQAKRSAVTFDDAKASNAQRRHFILTRQIGHHLEMPGSQNWHLYKDNCNQCYICDRRLYCVFFWSPQIGAVEAEQVGITADEKYKLLASVLNPKRQFSKVRQRLCQKLDPSLMKVEVRKQWDEEQQDFIQIEEPEENQDILSEGSDIHIDGASVTSLENEHSQSRASQPPKDYHEFFEETKATIFMKNLPRYARNFKLPQLYGDFNNWMPQPMIPVHRFSLALNNDQEPDVIKMLQKQRQCRISVQDVKELTRLERKHYQNFLDQWRMRHHRDEVWTAILKRLIAYKNPHYTSVTSLRHIDTSELYMCANFVGSGRQDYVVQHYQDFYFHQTLAGYRIEDVVVQNLELDEKIKIERNPNVFKNWQVDTDTIIDNCAKLDFKFWKIEKFIKDPNEIEDIKKILRENYIFLKELFTQAASKSVFPSVNCLETSLIFSEAGLLSKEFTQGICDTQFIAARVDAEKRGFKIFQQNALDCNRFEFLECVVRVAQAKYKGVCSTVTESVQTLIQALKSSFKGPSTQQFRNETLWTREVNLTLDANKKSLKVLYDRFKKYDSKLKQQYAIDLMTKTSTKIVLSDNEAMHCFAMSLQTCTDILRDSRIKMWHIDQMEFLEMIGRVAATFYASDAATPLHEKINKVLDEWLPMVNCIRQEPEYYETVGGMDSDSDEGNESSMHENSQS